VLLIPIGHERASVYRLPWITTIIAAFCLILQVRASIVEPPIEAELERIAQQINETQRELVRLHPTDGESSPMPRLDLTGLEGLSHLGLGGDQGPPPRPPSPEEIEKRTQALKQELETLNAQLEKTTRKLPVHQLGYHPARDGVLRMISAAFAHGGWMHLLGNLLFLYLVGCNIEDRWGRARFAAFYFAGILMSGYAFKLWHPHSEQALVGASGAIAAAMGAFAVVLGSSRIRFFYFYWLLMRPRWGTFEVRAWAALPLWFLEQALMSLIEAHQNMGTAYSAHVGGFLFGVGVAFALRYSGLDQRLAEASELSDDPDAEWSQDPLYAEAAGLAHDRHFAAALNALEELFRREPDNVQARELSLSLALELDDDGRLRELASLAFTSFLRAGEVERVASNYRKLRELRPDVELGEPALKCVIMASARAELDPLVKVDVAAQLIRQHPESALIPRAMWEASEGQLALGHPELAQRTRENLVHSFARDTFGERARRALAAAPMRAERG
jgi:membrane associated rhomboid family serine protease